MLLKFENFINESKFITKKSKIQGKGNFAKKDLRKNTNLGIGLIQIKSTGNPDVDFKRFDIITYTNHSNTPNTYYKKKGKNTLYIL